MTRLHEGLTPANCPTCHEADRVNALDALIRAAREARTDLAHLARSEHDPYGITLAILDAALRAYD